MDDQEKQTYHEQYKKAKESGIPFFPNAVFKDTLVVLVVFLILLGLTFFIGAPLEERADPADTSYTPRPEWYFLFLFQLLKYFPGELEVIGVVVLPTLAIVALFLLPFLDSSPKRHFRARPVVTGVTAVLVVGIVVLTVQSMLEAPPPAESAEGDPVASLYTENCAGCHGPTINVPMGTNLHSVIAEGRHEDMPAWSADLTSDEIDLLAGFISSPAGSHLFNTECSACHEVAELVAGNPIDLKNALELGPGFPDHAGVEVPDWPEALSREQRTALLNFLVAPDGRRLFITNCSSCHGRTVAFSGEPEELRQIINDGGLHLEMPSWQERLTQDQIGTLARYVVDPGSALEGEELYETLCVSCHGDRIPTSDTVEIARDVIATGGSHETMPVWGELLTAEQLDALTAFTLESARGTPIELGQQLYTENCANCHGDLGEGGENPARPDDIIAPISTAEYLMTRDDFTLKSIISQGQPNFGMSPFGAANGGPLDEDQIDAVVAFVRAWQADPPVELPPEVSGEVLALGGYEIFADICSQCHGLSGQGGIGPSLRAASFRDSATSESIFETISLGHPASDMIAWGSVLSSDQINQLVSYIQQLPIEEVPEEPEVEAPSEEAEEAEEAETAEAPDAEPEEEVVAVSFSVDVLPMFQFYCVDCHGSDGGYDASSYELIINSGDNGPAVIPGDPEASLLVHKLTDTQEAGDAMPPPPLRPLSEEQIQLIIDWIAAGAPDN